MPNELISLTPLNDLDPTTDSYQPYHTQLDRIFQDPSLCNIGIIGSRGSGKSSILRTFNEQQKRKAHSRIWKRRSGDFLFVSLIDFEDTLKKKFPKSASSDDGKGNQPSPTERVKQHLEYSLLCQILARCSPRKLYGSSLRGIPTPPPSFTGLSLLLAAITALIFGLIFEDRAGVFLRDIWNWPTPQRVTLHAFLYLLLGVLLFALTFSLLKLYLPTIRLKTLSLKLEKAEASVEMDSGKYCLDLYKFEIIHILDSIATDIGHTVVFEDMERLDQEICIDIMMKLRELNGMLQAHRTQRRKSLFSRRDAQPIRFLYVLSDEVFDSDARTKFFDITIPVLPALNAANWNYQVLHLLHCHDVSISMATLRPLLDILKPYLMDFRKVRSMIGEFLLFREIFKDNTDEDTTDPHVPYAVELVYSHILALSACRVLFPKEFSNVLCDCRFPDPGSNREMRRLMTQLRAGNHLTESIFDELCSSEQKLWAQRLELLETASPIVKCTLLKELIKSEDFSLVNAILDRQLLFRETDLDVIYQLGLYFFPLKNWYNPNHDTYHPDLSDRDNKPIFLDRITPVFMKLLDNLNRLPTREVPKAVTNLLIALDYCTYADFKVFLDLFKPHNLKEILCNQLCYANFETPPGGNHPQSGQNLSTWEELWESYCPKLLFTCLGEDLDSLPPDIRRKIFGSKSFEMLVSAPTPDP